MKAHPLKPAGSRPRRVLIVDDSRRVLGGYDVLIRHWYREATVLSFPCGTKALVDLLRHDPDLLILDLHHRALGGFDLLRILRGLSKQRPVRYPILVVSGLARAGSMREEIHECAGPDLDLTVLAKPVADEFFRALIGWLLKKQSAATARGRSGGDTFQDDTVRLKRWASWGSQFAPARYTACCELMS
jgi:DNA-binding response OmpR family regulator